MNRVYQKITSAVMSSCTDNVVHQENWEEKAEALTKQYMPSGSGFDCGTQLVWEKMSSGEATVKWNGRLVFKTSFHHMNENGMYDGWTEHVVTVKPHLVFGFTTTISGSDRNSIKDYICDTFELALNAIIPEEQK